MKCRQMYNNWIIVVVLCIALTSCHKNTIDVATSSIENTCNISFFQGIKPGMKYEELINMQGEPNDFYDFGSEDGDDSPTYYKNEGKIICHHSEDDVDIGMVEYNPYYNVTLHIEDFLYDAISKYDISDTTEVVRVYQNDTLFYKIFLYKCNITGIEYWLSKRKTFLGIEYQGG